MIKYNEKTDWVIRNWFQYRSVKHFFSRSLCSFLLPALHLGFRTLRKELYEHARVNWRWGQFECGLLGVNKATARVDSGQPRGRLHTCRLLLSYLLRLSPSVCTPLNTPGVHFYLRKTATFVISRGTWRSTVSVVIKIPIDTIIKRKKISRMSRAQEGIIIFRHCLWPIFFCCTDYQIFSRIFKSKEKSILWVRECVWYLLLVFHAELWFIIVAENFCVLSSSRWIIT